MALFQGGRARAAAGFRMAACPVPCPQRNIRDALGSLRRGSKKKLWEHQEAFVAEQGQEGYSTEAEKGDATTSPVTTTTAKAQTRSPRGKGKAKKSAENDPQIDLF